MSGTQEKLSVSDSELLVNKLKKEIEELKITHQSLQTQILSLERQKKAEANVSESKYQEQRNVALKALANEKEAVAKAKNEWDKKNETLTNQMIMAKENEKAIGDVKVQLDKLQVERHEIYDFRKEANKLMDKAKEQWGEIEGFKQAQESMKQNLASQIEKNKQLEKQLMDSIGDVQIRVKNVEIREKNCKALEMAYDNKKEVASVN